MAKWDLLKMGEFKELHLDTNRLYDEQKQVTSKHNAIVELALLVSRWLENTETSDNSEYRAFKNHFIGKTKEQWENMIQLGKDLQEIEKSEVLLEVQSKLEIGLNLLHLIKTSLEEIGGLCTFFCNKRKVLKKISRAHKGAAAMKVVLEKLLDKTPGRVGGGLEFFEKTEVLLGSFNWNYIKVITDQGEYNLRKVMDAFF